MLRMILLILLSLFVLLVVGSIILFKVLGWWAVPAMFVLLIVGLFVLKKMAGKVVEKLFKIPFKAKGAVLRGATAQIHDVSRTTRPEGEITRGGGLSESVDWQFHWIETTITPAPSNGPFQLWDPGDLSIAPSNARADDTDDSDEAGSFIEVEIQQDGVFTKWDGDKYPGPQRLRLLAATPSSMRSGKFRYYFELFGNVQLP